MKDLKEGNRTHGNRRSNPTVWILAGLLVVTTGLAIFFGSRSSNLNSERNVLSQNLTDLDEQKLNLEDELATLDESYQTQIAANDTLATTLETRLKEVDDLKGRVWSAKQKLAKSEEENKVINDRLAQLEELKENLEGDIVALQETNQELSDVNEQISHDLQMSEEEKMALDAQLQDMSKKNDALVQRLQTIAPAGFVATNFNVTAARKNNKLTARAKQADRINVEFDINDVPAEFQNEEELYLVVTQFDGNPIDVVETAPVEVGSTVPVAINVVDRQKTVLKDRQSIEMTFDADRDLESGLYNLMVYADQGFLGATTFQLR